MIEIGRVFTEYKDKLVIIDGENKREHEYLIPKAVSLIIPFPYSVPIMIAIYDIIIYDLYLLRPCD